MLSAIHVVLGVNVGILLGLGVIVANALLR
jgi:hypothetical protein